MWVPFTAGAAFAWVTVEVVGEGVESWLIGLFGVAVWLAWSKWSSDGVD